MGLKNIEEASAAVPVTGSVSAGVHGRLEPLHGQTVVIKYGGAAMEKPGLRDLFSRDIALVRTLGVRPVVVHGRFYVAQLRRKLEAVPARPRYLLTEPGVGYRLVAES